MTFELGLVNLGDNLPDPATGAVETDAEKHLRLFDQARAAERAGFAVFQLGEHHFNHYTIASPVVVLAAIAQVVPDIRLGTGVSLLPTLDALRLAEDFATLDVLSGGRAEIGVGRGVFDAIFRATARPAEHAGAMLAEGIELLHRLLTEVDVTWSGEWRTPLEDITVRPRPIQAPIPLWCGSTSTLDLAARLGLPCLWVSVLSPFEALAAIADEYRAAWAEAGRGEDDLQLGIAVHYHVAATSQAARQRFAPHYWQYHECSDSIGKSKLQRRVRPQRRTQEMLETVAVVGSAEEVVDRIGRARDLLGLTRVSLVADLGGLPQDTVLEVIERTGTDVIPALRRAAPPPKEVSTP